MIINKIIELIKIVKVIFSKMNFSTSRLVVEKLNILSKNMMMKIIILKNTSMTDTRNTTHIKIIKMEIQGHLHQ